ncbi:MAG: hypothetical protein ABIE22_00615 [archaeon]
MAKSEAELKNFLKEIKGKEIIFKPHFYDKQRQDRLYLSEELIINSLKDPDKFLGFQDQSKENVEKYRIAIKLSGSYNLVIICEIKNKSLYIITSWKTSRKWQKAIQK